MAATLSISTPNTQLPICNFRDTAGVDAKKKCYPLTSSLFTTSLSSSNIIKLMSNTFNTGKGFKVVCMAHPRRVKMVQQQIHRELADMLLHDSVLQEAVVPESGLGADMYLSSMATISDVEISKDLQVAKVFISVYGDEREQEIALEGLKSKAKYVRMGLGKRMSLRMTPEVRFVKDDSLERGSRVLELLDKVKQDRERKERGDTTPTEPSIPLRDDVDDENYQDLEDEEEEEEEEVQKPRSKKKLKSMPTMRNASRGLTEGGKDIDWDDDELKDFDFSDDENIILIKKGCPMTDYEGLRDMYLQLAQSENKPSEALVK